MKLSLALEYKGWIDIKLWDDDNCVEIPGSFLSDIVNDLTNRISTLTEGANEVIVRVQTEPGEYRIRALNTDDICLVEVYEFDDNFSSNTLEQGTILFKSYIELPKLLKLIYTEITKLKEVGEEEYLRVWGCEFPNAAYERLKRAINRTQRE